MATHWHPKQELESLGGHRSQPPKRASRVADVIKKELSLLLVQWVRDPYLREISISRVTLSDDLRHAKIYYTMFQPEGKLGQVEKSLAKAAGYVAFPFALKAMRSPCTYTDGRLSGATFRASQLTSKSGRRKCCTFRSWLETCSLVCTPA